MDTYSRIADINYCFGVHFLNSRDCSRRSKEKLVIVLCFHFLNKSARPNGDNFVEALDADVYGMEATY